MIKLTALTLLAAVCATGCVGTPGTNPDGAFALADGIYNLQVAPATGDCQPATLTGPLRLPMQLFVGRLGHGLSVPMPPDSTESSVERYELVDGRWYATVNTCGATHEIDLVVDVESGSRLDLTRTDSWSNVAAATRGMAGCYVPQHDCRASTQLTYTLADACPAGCLGRSTDSILTNTCDCSSVDASVP
jgi:hypothetical protein